MKKNIIYRQGDVILKKIVKLPDTKLEKVDKGLLLRGEATNHAHYACDCEVVKDEKGTMYIDATNESVVAVLRHLLETTGNWTGEHTEITLEPGVYEVVPQRQFNPYLKAAERNRD